MHAFTSRILQQQKGLHRVKNFFRYHFSRGAGRVAAFQQPRGCRQNVNYAVGVGRGSNDALVLCRELPNYLVGKQSYSSSDAFVRFSGVP